MRAWVSLASIVTLLSACSSGGENARERAPVPRPEARAEPRPPRYALHEWGLLGTVLDAPGDAPLAFGAGPIAAGQRADLGAVRTRATAEQRGSGGLGLVGTGLGGGKPVIYVHLLDRASLRFELRISVPGGRFLEHFPGAAIERSARGESLRWNVEARTSACPSDPLAGVDLEARCASVPDRFCELPDLGLYAATGASCLGVGSEASPLLFYRATGPRHALPLGIERRPDGGLRITAAPGTPSVGSLIRVHRDRETGLARVLVSAAPSPGGSLELPPTSEASAADASAGLRFLVDRMRGLGLTDSEIEAFERAWNPDLFGADPQLPEGTIGLGTIGSLGGAIAGLALEPPAELRRAEEYVAYFLPPALVERIVPLSATPPPAELRRAFLVRVSLDRPAAEAEGGAERERRRGAR